MSKFLKQRAVFTLVDKESGLLPLEPVDVELQTVLKGYVAVVTSDQVFVLGVEMSLIGNLPRRARAGSNYCRGE